MAELNGQAVDVPILATGVSLTPVETRPPPPPPDPVLTRHNVANRVLWGYLILLGAVIATPIALMFIKGTNVDNAASITIALSGALSGLVGVLGYVIGFYFKGEEQRAQAVTPRTAAPKRSRSSIKTESTKVQMP
jgi:hypothetical protein